MDGVRAVITAFEKCFSGFLVYLKGKVDYFGVVYSISLSPEVMLFTIIGVSTPIAQPIENLTISLRMPGNISFSPKIRRFPFWLTLG